MILGPSAVPFEQLIHSFDLTSLIATYTLLVTHKQETMIFKSKVRIIKTKF